MNESFYRNMMEFLREDSPEGDLARDMRRSGDESDLSQIRSWDDLAAYLICSMPVRSVLEQPGSAGASTAESGIYLLTDKKQMIF